MAAVFALDVSGLACCLLGETFVPTVVGRLYFMPGSFPMTNHVSANGGCVVSVRRRRRATPGEEEA